MTHYNCTTARQLSIVEYLAQCGFTPQYIKGDNHWYFSPLREENHASFKVNNKLNAWFDFGIGEGGNLVDLGIKLYNCSVADFLDRLNNGNYTLSFHQQKTQPQTANVAESKITIVQASELSNLTLVKYLHEREIDYYNAKAYCKEVLFSLNGQQHLAIGFVNRSGGYELRSAQHKLSSSPKDLTFIDRRFDTVHVLEGFTDFLSLLTINRRDMPGNFLVLNSLSFTGRSLEIIVQHKDIKLYLDHDKAAVKAMEMIKQAAPNAEDASRFYSGYKDLNAYWKHEVKQRRWLEL